MEFGERLNALAAKIREQVGAIETEEATKNAFIMPFLNSVLGYDVFNPTEVVPEFVADVGVKKGEKIDYAIMRDGSVQILVECKRIGDPLSLEHASQLYRYFAVTNARIALLTNGLVYKFYTDLDAKNRMDSTPFLVLDLSDIDPAAVPELRKLTKDEFDLDSVLNAAESLKFVSAIKREIAAQFREPSDDWVKFFTSRVYEGAFTQRVREQFQSLVQKASTQFLTDQVNSRLKTALGSETYTSISDPDSTPAANTGAAAAPTGNDRGIVTTSTELSGYAIVKAIGCSEVKPDRIVGRDSKSYFAILLDDNNRKPIARLHFNSEDRLYVGLLDEAKVEIRHPIGSLDEIYTFSDEIRDAIHRYM